MSITPTSEATAAVVLVSRTLLTVSCLIDVLMFFLLLVPVDQLPCAPADSSHPFARREEPVKL
jgi:hypothetical protein